MRSRAIVALCALVLGAALVGPMGMAAAVGSADESSVLARSYLVQPEPATDGSAVARAGRVDRTFDGSWARGAGWLLLASLTGVAVTLVADRCTGRLGDRASRGSRWRAFRHVPARAPPLPA